MTVPAERWQGARAWGGLTLGPALWAVNMELGQILPYAECGSGFRTSTLTTFLGAALALLGAGMSYRVSSLRGRNGRYGFLGTAGTMAGMIFAFAQLLQGGATLVLTGCER